MAKTTAPKKKKIERTANAVFLSTYIEHHHDGESLKLSKLTSESASQINRWVRNNAVIANGDIYLCASDIKESEEDASERNRKLSLIDTGVDGIVLNVYMKEKHKGNQSDFSRSIGLRQQQISRWLQKHCLFIDGQIYRMQKNLVANDKSAA